MARRVLYWFLGLSLGLLISFAALGLSLSWLMISSFRMLFLAISPNHLESPLAASSSGTCYRGSWTTLAADSISSHTTGSSNWLLKMADFFLGVIYKSGYEMIASENCWCFPVWQAGVISKVAAFLWLALQGKVLTCDRLTIRGIRLLSCCYLCGKEDETLDHLLLHWLYARSIWQQANGA